MNDQRRKTLEKALAHLNDAKNLCEEVKGEEDEALENMPDAFKNGERGQKASEVIDALDEAIGTIENAEDNISTALS